MITGFATATGTQGYAKKYEDFQYQELNANGLRVSQAGFGCYRVDVSVDEHRRALKKALREGINLIDTSANYADGHSEELVGVVLAEMIAAGELAREEVVVVSKVGYLQGQNFKLSLQRKQEGRPFPDLVEYGQGLEHCIHPEFLEDQLTRSLQRLQMETLDEYLLHNPEYYLGWAKKAGVPLEEARAEYYRRIELAFRHLETEVEKGRIRCYGISSNTFPAAADDAQFTSLEKVWTIAESVSPNHHFQVIQLPMNLYETGGVTESNQSTGQSVIAYAESKKIGVLINRPLNALSGNSITRLADVQLSGAADLEQLVQQIPSLLDRLVAEEHHFKHVLHKQLSLGETENDKLDNQLSAGELLSQYWRNFSSLEHWNEVVAQFLIPTVQGGIEILAQTEAPQEVRDWVDKYVQHVNEALQTITNLYQHQSSRQVDAIKAKVAAADSDWGAADTLSQMAIRALRSTRGITSVLVGMRRDSYVDDVVNELLEHVEVKERNASWKLLK